MDKEFKFSENEVKEKLKENNTGNIEVLIYRGMREKSDFLCKDCDHTWEADTYSVCVSGHGCPKCRRREGANKRKVLLTTKEEDIISFINNSECLFVSFVGKYVNLKTKANVIFSCGHEGVISLNVFVRPLFSKICRKCSISEGNRKKTIDAENIVETVESYGFKSVVFPNGYIDGKSLVSYTCEYGHETTKSVTNFKMIPTCKECKKIEMSKRFSGENGFLWKGGITHIKRFLYRKISGWRKESIYKNGEKCVITGNDFNDIHHLYSFMNIIEDSFKELGLEILEDISEYSNHELNMIISKIREVHNRHPYGVPLDRKIHVLFHTLYGNDGLTSPEDFYDFAEKIKTGEIKI